MCVFHGCTMIMLIDRSTGDDQCIVGSSAYEWEKERESRRGESRREIWVSGPAKRERGK